MSFLVSGSHNELWQDVKNTQWLTLTLNFHIIDIVEQTKVIYDIIIYFSLLKSFEVKYKQGIFS